MPRDERTAFLASLTTAERYAVLVELFDWRRWARPKQLPPSDWISGDKPVWLITSGRGFGKTRTGAETVRAEVAAGRATRVAMVERTPKHAREGMLDGHAGIFAVSLPHERPIYNHTRQRLEWPNGAIGHVYTAAEPDAIRGPEHDLAWGEEAASWKFGAEAWSNLQLGMRVGPHPRTVVTTTPKPVRWLRRVRDAATTVHVTGSTHENRANLSRAFLNEILGEFAGTHLEAQEIEGAFLEQMPGALWTRDVLAATRVRVDLDRLLPDLDVVVVSIDPAITANEDSDETGIIAAGAVNATAKRPAEGYVLADESGRYTPDEWARTALRLCRRLGADRIVAEVNQGGDMVRHTIQTVRPKNGDGLDGRDVPVRVIHASRGKQTRAEPVSAKFEQGRAHIVGTMQDLEDQLCSWEPTGTRKSPDRLDAAVHALTDLLITGRSQWAEAGYHEKDPEIADPAEFERDRRREIRELLDEQEHLDDLAETWD